MVRRRRFVVLLSVLVVLVATIRLFVLPARDGPSHADAIFVPGGSGARPQKAAKLAREGYASMIVESRPTPASGCLAPIPNVRIICFRPTPFTTQGEARYLADAVRRYHWKHVIVVTSNDQTTRARLRIKRCTNVSVSYVTTPTPVALIVYKSLYEWAALVKALVVQRGC